MLEPSYKQLIEDRIKVLLDAESKAIYSKETDKLYNYMKDQILSSGKRFRPLLFLSAYEAYGGSDSTKFIELCALIELYHQALLIHDDVIDEDYQRNNRPNILSHYLDKNLPPRFSQAVGILAGDILLSLVNKKVSEDQNLSTEQRLDITKLINETTIKTSYGQQLDCLNAGAKLYKLPEKYIETVYSLKTAYYSVRMPMLMAAIILDLPNSERKTIENFAKSYGIYFQLLNDYQDYFAKQAPFKDFKEGKLTTPLAIAFRKSKREDLSSLKRLFANKKLSKKDQNFVSRVLIECQAKEIAIEQLEEYFNQSVKLIEKLKANNPILIKELITDLHSQLI